MRNRLNTAVAATAFATVTGLWSTPSASAGDPLPNWKVPVLFVTDRQPKKSSFGPRRLVEKDTVSRMQSGIVDVSITQETPSALQDWQKYPRIEPTKSSGKLSIKVFDGDSAEDLNKDFDSAVKAAVKDSAQKEVFVFVHGFNNSFAAAAANAAQLELYTGCPVILYSWPSVSRLYRYSADECNNEWSQEHFNQFIEHLYSLKQSANIKVSIVAHSMGNRLFVRAIPLLGGRGIFSDIYMVNPDFDAQTFMHYLSRYIPKDGLAQNVRGQLLISRKDNALSASEALFGGYTRLGQGLDTTLSALTSPELFTGVWKKNQQPKVKQSPQPAKDGEKVIASVEKAIRVYDVTELDHGLIGHKVPHEFIAWMHHQNQAPPGFALKPDHCQSGNRLARMFAGKLKQDIGSPTGKFWMVTKDNQPIASLKTPN